MCVGIHGKQLEGASGAARAALPRFRNGGLASVGASGRRLSSRIGVSIWATTLGLSPLSRLGGLGANHSGAGQAGCCSVFAAPAGRQRGPLLQDLGPKGWEAPLLHVVLDLQTCMYCSCNLVAGGQSALSMNHLQCVRRPIVAPGRCRFREQYLAWGERFHRSSLERV